MANWRRRMPWLAIGAIAGMVIARSPLPIFDRGFRIYAVSSESALDDLVALLGRHGLKPLMRLDGGGTRRVLMSDGITLINFTNAERPANAAIALPARCPLAAAANEVRALRAAGYAAELIANPDESLPKGAMAFVKTDVFPGNSSMLVFRRHKLWILWQQLRGSRAVKQ